MWIGEVLRDPAVARRRAENGAAYLDAKFGPDWDQKIDVKRLDIGTFACVLGQLNFQGMICVPGPRQAVDCGFTCGLVMDVLVLLTHVPLIGRLLPFSDVARSYDLLTQAWRQVLRQRRQPAVVATANLDIAAPRRGRATGSAELWRGLPRSRRLRRNRSIAARHTRRRRRLAYSVDLDLNQRPWAWNDGGVADID
jgi:hypothetical protein